MGAVVVFVNRVGFEDGLCFWGGSMAVGPDGRVLAQAPMLDEALSVAAFDTAELRRQRLVTPLARDERLLLRSKNSSASNGDAMNPEPVEGELAINAELVAAILTRFIRSEIHRAGFSRAVVGLSGGIDSSVVTTLAARRWARKTCWPSPEQYPPRPVRIAVAICWAADGIDEIRHLSFVEPKNCRSYVVV